MSNDLQLVERAERALGFVERKTQLAELAKKSERIIAITNAAGYQECHAARMVLKNTRVDIQKTGKEARDDATKFSKAVIEKEKELIGLIEPEEARLAGIQQAWDDARERERREAEEARQRRVAEMHTKIAAISAEASTATGKPSSVIRGRLDRVRSNPPSIEEFAEFQAQAVEAHDAAVLALQQLLQQQLDHEAEQERIREERAELERLREADRVRREEQERKDAEERAAQARADAERRAAEEQEHRERLAEQRRQLEEQQRLENERQAEADRIRQENEAAERERQRVESARLQAERDALAQQRADLERMERAKEIADATLIEAARAAHGLLVSSGFGEHITTLKLGAALERECQQKRQAAPATRRPREAKQA
jgi:hypothetical protein